MPKPFKPLTRDEFSDLLNRLGINQYIDAHMTRYELTVAYSQALDALRDAEQERDALMFEIQTLSDLCPDHRGTWNSLRMSIAGVLCPWLGPIFKSISRLMAIGNRIKDKP